VIVISRAGARTEIVAAAGPLDERFAHASVTKLWTSLAVLVEVDRGTCALGDAVGPPGSTLAHLLSHASGLPLDGGAPIAMPGVRRIYSNTGIDLAADHAARRGGTTPGALVRRNVLEPLGATATVLDGPPSSGAIGTVRDLGVLAAELLAPTLVSPSIASRWRTVHLPDLVGVLPGYGRQDPCAWGLGPEVKGSKRPHWTGATWPAISVGHFGQAGGFVVADHVHGVCVATLGDAPFGAVGEDHVAAFHRCGARRGAARRLSRRALRAARGSSRVDAGYPPRREEGRLLGSRTMRAVITGAAGFVGRHLAAHLSDAGDDVVGLDHEHDVTDVDAMAGALVRADPEAIYHLAALSHVGASWDDPAAVLRVNVLGTDGVLEAARRVVPDASVLVVSSAETYGVVRPDELPLTERAELRPGSPYAASKAAAELVAVQASRGYGQRVVVARPFNHIGPGQSPTFFVPAVARRLVEARRAGVTEVPVGNLDARRDFTDVRDVVRAYRLLARLGSSGVVYNVCSGRDVSVGDVADVLRSLIYPEARFVEDPSLTRPLDIPVLRGDASRLREGTGWRPEIDLATTLRDVVAEATQLA